MDDRGSVAFVNDANLKDFVRFYLVRNNSVNFVRAWHGHRRERKLVIVVSGSALICCVKVDDWVNPGRELPVHRFVLSADKPAALLVPPGFANGSMSLREGTAIAYFSDATLAETKSDDFRYPARTWDPWHVVER